MLPFLKPKREAGLIITERKPDGGKKELHEEGDENHAIEAAAEDILRAISSKDAKHLALALRAAFQILDAEPHEEGPHESEEQE